MVCHRKNRFVRDMVSCLENSCLLRSPSVRTHALARSLARPASPLGVGPLGVGSGEPGAGSRVVARGRSRKLTPPRPLPSPPTQKCLPIPIYPPPPPVPPPRTARLDLVLYVRFLAVGADAPMSGAWLLWLLLAHPGSARASDHFDVDYRDAGRVTDAQLEIQGLPNPIHFLQSGPKGASKLVVFLHGAAFSARMWQEIGVLDAVGLAGMRAVAPDLPGYANGLSGHRKQIQQDRQTFLVQFLDVLGWPSSSKVVVVAASMGGTYGLPFVIAQPERVAGYVTIAALLDSLATAGCSDTPCSSAPCLLIWGELDDANGDKPRMTEALFGIHQKVVYPNAPHPCYLKYPELFSRQVLSFLGAVNATVPTHAPDQVSVTGKVYKETHISVHAAW